MVSVSIPKEITKGEELVVIPRKLYESFLRAFKTKSDKILPSLLNKGLKEALSDIKTGKIIGPFSSAEEGLRVLKRAK
jgi:hypothetical protein